MVLETIIPITLAMISDDVAMAVALELSAILILILVGVILGHSFDWRAAVMDKWNDR